MDIGGYWWIFQKDIDGYWKMILVDISKRY